MDSLTWNFQNKAEFAIIVIASRVVTFTDVKVCLLQYGILACAQNTTVRVHESEIHCRLINIRTQCLTRLQSLMCTLVEAGETLRENLCLLHSHIHSQVSTFSVARGKILGLRHLWTFLWSDSFLIFWHIMPWSCGWRFLTEGQELRNKIHQTFPKEFGQCFHCYPCPNSW